MSFSGPEFRCRSVDCYEPLSVISEGSFGRVYKARSRSSGKLYALKRLKLDSRASSRHGFPATALREINLLFQVRHENVVELREVVLGKRGEQVYMVMEFVENELKSLLEAKSDKFSVSEVKCLMIQLLKGLQALHSNWIFHRDLKTSNLLISDEGRLKIADLGLARKFGSPLRKYSKMVVTLWYRAPELLLGEEEYSAAVDMWSCGCIFAELLIGKPLFMGADGEIQQVDKIFELLGTPGEQNWPDAFELPFMKKFTWRKHPGGKLRELFPKLSFTGGRLSLTNAGFDLLSRMLSLDPKKRISASEALAHPWLVSENPKPQDPALISLTLPHQLGDTHRSH